jgi:hypothetical protein
MIDVGYCDARYADAIYSVSTLKERCSAMLIIRVQQVTHGAIFTTASRGGAWRSAGRLNCAGRQRLH